MSVSKDKRSPYYRYNFQFEGHRFYGPTRCKKKREAERFEARIRAELEQGNGQRTMTLDVAAARFWTEVAEEQSSSETTWHQLEGLVLKLGPAKQLHRLSESDLSDYIVLRRGEPIKRGVRVIRDRFPSPSTINREIELLRRVIYRARDVWNARTPKINWKALKLKEPRPRDRVLSEAEEERLFSEVAPHLRPAVEFSLLTGVRLDNCITLDWKQVDLPMGEITFVVKGDKLLVFPIYNDLLVFLANLGPQDKGLLFTYRGRPIKTWKRAWRRAKERAGIKDFRWHDLRHTVGSRWVADGVDISKVQDLLGHAEISTTRRYVHHNTGDLRRALDALKPAKEIAK